MASANYRNTGAYRSTTLNYIGASYSGSTLITALTTVTTKGVIFDKFSVEQSLIIFPDEMQTNGVIFDNFYVEESLIFFPDTISTTTEISAPQVFTNQPINAQSFTGTTTIPIPTIFTVVEEAIVYPETVEGSSVFPFPTLRRSTALYELTGDPIGFAIVPAVSITIDRPEEVDRSYIALRTVYIDTDPYRLYDGRPVAVPKWDMNIGILVSSVGHVLTGREDPVSIDTGAGVRWIAGVNYWDEAYNRWYPTDDGLSERFWWETTDEASPKLWDAVEGKGYVYYLGKEEFIRSSVSFDEEDFSHMWSNFDGGNLSSETLTLMLVVSLNPVQRNQNYYTVIDSGTEPPVGPSYGFSEPWAPDTSIVNRTKCDVFPHKLRIKFDGDLSTTSPDRNPTFGQIGILTLKYSTTDFYAEWFSEEGKYSRFITPKKSLEGNTNVIYHNLVLGRSNGSVIDNMANMDVFEINMWTDDPDKEALALAKSSLVSAYGITK